MTDKTIAWTHSQVTFMLFIHSQVTSDSVQRTAKGRCSLEVLCCCVMVSAEWHLLFLRPALKGSNILQWFRVILV